MCVCMFVCVCLCVCVCMCVYVCAHPARRKFCRRLYRFQCLDKRRSSRTSVKVSQGVEYLIVEIHGIRVIICIPGTVMHKRA